MLTVEESSRGNPAPAALRHSWFFREVETFEGLHATVLPDLLKSRAASRRVSAWSPCTGGGEEVYSLVLTLRHHFPAMKDWNLSVLGTDSVERDLSKARQASYSDADVERGLPLALLALYFFRQVDRWILSHGLRSCASFRLAKSVADLGPEQPSFDIVCARWMLLQAGPTTRPLLLRDAAARVAPGGYILFGSDESLAGLAPDLDRFRPVGKGVFKAQA